MKGKSLMEIIGLLILLGISIIIYKFFEKKRIARYQGEYVEQFPYDPPALAYAYLESHGFSRLEHLITYFLMKWIREKRMIPETVKGKLFKSKENIHFIFSDNCTTGLTKDEFRLIRFFATAKRRRDKGVTSYSIYRKLNARSKFIVDWEEKFKKRSLFQLSKDGISVANVNTVFRVMRDFMKKSNIVDTGEEQSIDLKGDIYRFQNYLKEFDDLHKGKPVDIDKCDDLLVSSALINMQNEAFEQFSQVHHNFHEQSVFSKDLIQEVEKIARYFRRLRIEKEKKNKRK